MAKTQVVIRVDGLSDSYGIGEPVTEDKKCCLFRAGNYNLTKKELKKKLSTMNVEIIEGAGVLRG